MFYFNSFIYGCIIVIYFNFVQTLVKLAVDNKDRLTTETIIHNTINDLFRTLNIDEEKLTLNEYNTLNEYFTSFTLEGNKNVNKVIRLTKVNNNTESSLVDIINAVLGEDDLETEKTEIRDIDINVVEFINNFLIDLQLLTKEFDVDNVYLNVNPDVLKHLKYPDGTINDNTKKIDLSLNKSEDNNATSDNEFWGKFKYYFIDS